MKIGCFHIFLNYNCYNCGLCGLCQISSNFYADRTPTRLGSILDRTWRQGIWDNQDKNVNIQHKQMAIHWQSMIEPVNLLNVPLWWCPNVPHPFTWPRHVCRTLRWTAMGREAMRPSFGASSDVALNKLLMLRPKVRCFQKLSNKYCTNIVWLPSGI